MSRKRKRTSNGFKKPEQQDLLLTANIEVELNLYKPEGDEFLLTEKFAKTSSISIELKNRKGKDFPFYCQELIGELLASYRHEIFATGASFYTVEKLTIETPMTSTLESPEDYTPLAIASIESKHKQD